MILYGIHWQNNFFVGYTACIIHVLRQLFIFWFVGQFIFFTGTIHTQLTPSTYYLLMSCLLTAFLLNMTYRFEIGFLFNFIWKISDNN